MPIDKCPVCAQTKFKDVFSSQQLPKYNLTYSLSYQDSLSIERVGVNFVHCESCDFLFNKIYQQLDYKESSYDASRTQSKVIIDYYNHVLESVSPHLVNIQHAVEVGAGDCYFSELVADQIGSSVSAYDPTFSGNLIKNGVARFQAYYDKSKIEKPDLVFFRHVLEHISDVRSFLVEVLHETPKFVFIEVPCAEFVAKNNWHYFSNEHCSYFSESSLVELLNVFSYNCIYIDKVFNGENIIAVFQYSNDQSPRQSISDLQCTKFTLENNFKKWKSDIISKIPNQSLVWGAAGKGVTSLNLLELTSDVICMAIDINPNLWGKFIPGTGIEIVSPSQAVTKFPDKTIYIMNPLYKNEIIELTRSLGHTGKIVEFF
jgi:hypothetical protein